MFVTHQLHHPLLACSSKLNEQIDVMKSVAFAHEKKSQRVMLLPTVYGQRNGLECCVGVLICKVLFHFGIAC
jgi:hypothetical protein